MRYCGDGSRRYASIGFGMRDPASRKPVRRRRTDRDRKARYRRRQAEGRAVYSVEIGPEVLDLLVATKWLAEIDVSDRKAVGAAIGALLKDAAKRA